MSFCQKNVDEIKSMLNECGNLKHLFNRMNPDNVAETYYYLRDDNLEVCIDYLEGFEDNQEESWIIWAEKDGPTIKKLRRWINFSRFDMLDELRRANHQLLFACKLSGFIRVPLAMRIYDLEELHYFVLKIIDEDIVKYHLSRNDTHITVWDRQGYEYHYDGSRKVIHKCLALYAEAGFEGILWYLEKADSAFRRDLWKEFK